MLPNRTLTLRGFTVVELTVAMSVSAMVSVAAYELFRTLKSVSNEQDKSMVESWEIINVLDQIREDLVHAVPKDYGEEAVFAGSNPVFEFQEFKLLKFYSLCVTNDFNKVCGIRGVHKIEYELVKEKDSIYFYRVAAPIIGKDKLSHDENRELLSSKIEEVKISFHNGRRLEASFSSKQHLPVYVELKLTAYGQTWLLAVKLPCGVAKTEEVS